MTIASQPMIAGDKDQPVLELAGVTLESEGHYDSGLWNVTLTLKPGELALVRIEREHARMPLADVAGGLCDPDVGQVRFLGEDWAAMPALRASIQRGKIGRIFEGQNWVSNLDVDENIFLAQRHHTSRTREAIVQEAATLARIFGLPGLPRGRPAELRKPDLQRAACVRAFVGAPQLLLFERPTEQAPELVPPLINLLRSVRRRGAAVLWTVSDSNVWNDRGIRPTYRCVMSGSQLLMLPPDAASINSELLTSQRSS